MFRLTLAIFFGLAVFSFSVFSQTSQDNLLKALLDLPAPAPFEKNENTGSTDNADFPVDFLNKVPPDDAPIEHLMAFWSRQNYSPRDYANKSKPTEVVAQRIFDEIEKDPSILLNYLNILPPKKYFADFIKQYYDDKLAEFENLNNSESADKPPLSVKAAVAAAGELAISANEQAEMINSYTLSRIKGWLTYNSRYFSDELAKKAGRIKDQNEYVRDKDDFIALAKVDWEKAEPHAERLINDKTQPASATVAKWAYYAHFLQKKDERETAKYRRLLQDVVEDRKAAAGVRDLALDALVYEGDFEGRDDWYLSLLEDETLFDLDGYTGLKTLISESSPEEWIPRMIPLVGNQNPAVHNAAVRNLVGLLAKAGDEQDKLILRALLPWLSNKAWAREERSERNTVIRMYGTVDLPESIPALIAIVQNEKPTAAEYSANSNSNTAYNMIDKAADAVKEAINNAKETNTEASDKAADAIKAADVADKAADAINVTNALGLSDTQTAAISALAKYKDSRAVPVLFSVLEDTSERYEREAIISAIIACGGYDANQQLNYIEIFARKISAAISRESLEEILDGAEFENFSLSEQIGMVLSQSNEPDEDLVRLGIGRIKALQKSEPQIADTLKGILQRWKSKVLDIERLTSIADNTADIETIVRVLTTREELSKNYRNQIFAMRGNGGVAGGIAACLPGNQNEVLSAVNSRDPNTQIAGLACARLLRVPLPVQAVGQLLKSPNSLLALAAERYLIAEDSREARNLVLAKHPGEAKILGSRFAFFTDKKGNYDRLPINRLFASVNPERFFYHFEVNDLDKIQEKLREEVKANADLLGVYAFLQDLTSGHQILRIYKDKAVYAWYEDDARYRERIVSPEELKMIFDFVAAHQIEEIKPILRDCHHGCPSQEFVMFGRNGGRRVFVYSQYFREQPLYGLKMIFEALKQGESKLHYWLQDKIAGLEVLLDEKHIKTLSLWKDGEDFRVLILDEKRREEIEEQINKQAAIARQTINDSDFGDNEEYDRRYSEITEELQKQRIERRSEPYAWRSIKENNLGEKVSPPAGDHSLSDNDNFPEVANLETPESVYKVRTEEFEVRLGDYNERGIWKVFRNGLTARISGNENYTNSIVTSADGKWAIATQRSDDYYTTELYRLNLQTGKEYEIVLPPTLNASPIAYIKTHDKFLILSAGLGNLDDYPPDLSAKLKKMFTTEDLKDKTPKYYLLDANTGSATVVKGDFTPFEQITFRNLQKTSQADEFWVAIPNEKKRETRIGRYDAKAFKFTEVMIIPEIKLTSMDIWVDEKEAKIYFIYEGHLLNLPFKPNGKPAE